MQLEFISFIRKHDYMDRNLKCLGLLLNMLRKLKLSMINVSKFFADLIEQCFIL